MLKSALSLAVALSACASAVAAPLTDAALAQVVDQRLAGDRTGACFAVAVIDGSHVARSYRCANADAPPRIGADSAFEIGSVSKTMTAALTIVVPRKLFRWPISCRAATVMETLVAVMMVPMKSAL